jgi:S1-C subfamily serine protease
VTFSNAYRPPPSLILLTGIGFAVPGDSVKDSTDKIIELDKQKRLRSAKRKGRGWLGISVATSALEESLRNRLLKDNKSSGNKVVGTFITAIAPKSPFMLQQQQEEEEAERDLPPLVPVATTNFTNGTVEIGDRIVSVGGNPIENANAFLQEMKGRVEGENLSLTLEREGGDRRVVYVTLGQIPL